MISRISWALLALVLIVVTQVVTAASNPPGGASVNLDQPKELVANVITFIIFFLPAVVLAYFKNLSCRIISAIWHFLCAILLVLLPIIMIFTGNYIPGLVAGLTALVMFISGIVQLINNK